MGRTYAQPSLDCRCEIFRGFADDRDAGPYRPAPPTLGTMSGGGNVTGAPKIAVSFSTRTAPDATSLSASG